MSGGKTSYDLNKFRDSECCDVSNSPTESTVALIERGNWGKPIEFVLSCLNYAVGLGNVWRFPHLAFRNGGGIFLLVSFFMVFIIGLPLFFAELFIGQYVGLGEDSILQEIVNELRDFIKLSRSNQSLFIHRAAIQR